MVSTKEHLKKETIKWLNKLDNLDIKLKNPKKHGFLKNIKAYIKDSHYFTEKEDFVRAFEAVVWAWAWVEIGEQEGFLEIKK
ncbi:MAG: DUF357 domain-containing protein [Candidatus Huberarchaeum crystalense]|uniref:DUF357 domain-containing protein n=1 Tax=Huberarchaeum crystalense TaxID=2014257 RepID=A0A2G9LIX0_HUBC1|nr:DUF357 domain-containing protein [archaeon]OIP20292.1 MAG: hypothetical protein AUJ91_01595 [archaeon CG2_30_31_98]PIN66464.1 MAG: hypothetical protein COW69_02270 [Candidatus Huberarchaeum crystalense]NCS98174.1 DUF357 domain-containing protein [archaeon]PIV13733.1 MAG: DUF357 domain-containing protein [Candidatus Huberarchaeum crystalense]